MVTMYEKLAAMIETSIKCGIHLPGEKIASVRQCAQQQNLSITTVLRAYLLLESKGLIESRPQSGYFVRAQVGTLKEIPFKTVKPDPVSAEVGVSRLVLSTLRSIGADAAVPLGSPYPDPSLFPLLRLNQHSNSISRRHQHWSLMEDLPPGNRELIRQIARRYLESAFPVDPGEIIITVGATEAINLCLQAVAKPGDVIAVESPTYYANLHAIERMGMRAIEVETDHENGINLDALSDVLSTQKVAACMVMPNFQNPLGFEMPDEKKRQLVELLAERGIPVIENDVYRELHFGEVAPTSLKTYDKHGLVLHCSSFSKSLAPAYRIGWAMPGRYHAEVERLKFLNTLTTPSFPQRAIAEFMKYDGYDMHLRRVRRRLAQRAKIMTCVVKRFFPPGTQVSVPKGGYVLWVGLPGSVDAMKLYQEALRDGITVGPGHMFSTTENYKNCIRLNYSFPWSNEIEEALIKVGRLASFLCGHNAKRKEDSLL